MGFPKLPAVPVREFDHKMFETVLKLCYNAIRMPNPHRDVSEETFAKIIDQLSQMTCWEFELTSPTMHSLSLVLFPIHKRKILFVGFKLHIKPPYDSEEKAILIQETFHRKMCAKTPILLCY